MLKRSRAGVRSQLTRRNRTLAHVLADAAVDSMKRSTDGKMRIPIRKDVPRKVRKEAFAIASKLV